MLARNKLLITGALVLAFGACFMYQSHRLKIAHSTFDNYYAFRGCTSLVDRDDTSAHCQLADGTVIKLVLIEGRWYLDGDGPSIW